MDAAALFIAIVSALATGAATIIAWTSRADALSARDSAEAAQAAAVDAWSRAASALEESNNLQLRLTEQAVARERRRRRVELGNDMKDWYISEYMRATGGKKTTAEEREVRRALSIRAQTSDERAATLLVILLDRGKDSLSPGASDALLDATVKCARLADEWIEDPDAFWSTHHDKLSRDELVERIMGVSAAVGRIGEGNGAS